MIDVDEFRVEVVRPTLKDLADEKYVAHIPYSLAAENLLVGTVLQESGLIHLKQLGDGPALGVYQIEPATHMDVWRNFLSYRQPLSAFIEGYANFAQLREKQLVTNLAYATLIARIIYYRAPEALPDADDIEGLAKYWKQHYNTSAGKGTWPEWQLKYKEYCS